MNDREFLDIEIFQHSGKGIPLFMTDHKNWKGIYEYVCWDRALVLRKKNLPGRGLTKVEKRCTRRLYCSFLYLFIMLIPTGFGVCLVIFRKMNYIRGKI
jgi:hypothetical protein